MSNSCKTESGCKAGDKCVCSRTRRLKNNQVKSRRAFKTEKNDDKGAVAVVKTVPQWGCVSQDFEPSELPKKRDVSGKPDA